MARKRQLQQRLDQRKSDMAIKSAELEALQAAEQARIAAEEQKRVDMLAAEKCLFDEALKRGELTPADVRKILASRHSEETADLKRKLQVEREVARAQVAKDRAELRLTVADNDLEQFDSETNQLLQASEVQLTEDLDAIRLLSELNDRQMKEIEEAMISFCPEVQARLQFQADEANADDAEAAKRAKKTQELKAQFEKEREAKLKKLKELEAEKDRITKETEQEIAAMQAKEAQKLAKKQELAEKKAEQQAKQRAAVAVSDEDHEKIMADLKRQKTRIDQEAKERRAEQDKKLQERIRQKMDSAEKAKSSLEKEKESLEGSLAKSESKHKSLIMAHQSISRQHTLKLAPELTNSYSNDPLGLLAELPMVNDLQNLSSYLKNIDRKRVIGAADSPFMDISDAEYRTEGDLSFIKDLEPALQIVFNYAQSLVNHLCDRMDLEQVKVVVATSLPHNAMTNNAFRNSYHYNEALKTVFVREYLFDSKLGKLTLALAHFVAHLRSQAFEDDGDMGFLIHFFKAIKIIGEVQFKNVSFLEYF